MKVSGRVSSVSPTSVPSGPSSGCRSPTRRSERSRWGICSPKRWAPAGPLSAGRADLSLMWCTGASGKASSQVQTQAGDNRPDSGFGRGFGPEDRDRCQGSVGIASTRHPWASVRALSRESSVVAATCTSSSAACVALKPHRSRARIRSSDPPVRRSVRGHHCGLPSPRPRARRVRTCPPPARARLPLLPARARRREDSSAQAPHDHDGASPEFAAGHLGDAGELVGDGGHGDRELVAVPVGEPP